MSQGLQVSRKLVRPLQTDKARLGHHPQTLRVCDEQTDFVSRAVGEQVIQDCDTAFERHLLKCKGREVHIDFVHTTIVS